MLEPLVLRPAPLRVRFPTVSVQVPSIGGRLVQAAGAHDVLVITSKNPIGHADLLGGAPVEARWSTDTGDGLFTGYVHRVDPTFSAKSSTSSIVCVGASYPLMNRGTSVWVGATASEVVRQIAFKHGLLADVEEHPRVYTQIAQAGQSDWQLLQRLADETGYVLRMEGVTLLFRSRLRLARMWRPEATMVDLSALAGRKLASFTPKVGPYTPELGVSNTVQQASGIDAVSGVRITSTATPVNLRAGSDPLFTSPLVDDVVTTGREAVTAAQAAVENSRFSTLADLKVKGSPLISPERMVWLSGVPSDYVGYWTVRSAQHIWDNDSYRCEAVIGTDGLGGTQYLPQEASLRPVVNPHRPGGTPRQGMPVLKQQTAVVGTAGVPLSDFKWVSHVTERI